MKLLQAAVQAPVAKAAARNASSMRLRRDWQRSLVTVTDRRDTAVDILRHTIAVVTLAGEWHDNWTGRRLC